MTWEGIKAAGRAVRKYMWIIVSGVALASLMLRNNHNKRLAKKNSDIVWKHKEGSIFEDSKKADNARAKMNKHDSAAAKAREGIRRTFDEMAKPDPDTSNILHKWNSDRLRRDTDST